jgi:hypothetical protein
MNSRVSKRLLLGFLFLVLAFSLLLGCGSKQNNPMYAPLSNASLPLTAAASTQSSTSSDALSADVTGEGQHVICYVTETGNKYHCSGCSYLAKSCIPIELEIARQSYGPCSKCCPPR